MKPLTEEQKEANRRRAREWAARNREKVREYKRIRSKTPEQQQYMREYRAARREKNNEYNKAWRLANREKVRATANKYRTANRAAMNAHSRKHMRKINGVPDATRPQPAHCECCGRVPRTWHLDHNHDNGKFRGWLCNTCNLAIGHLGDTLGGLRRAIAYLERAE